MIEHVYPICNENGSDYLQIIAEDQTWDKKTLNQLRKEHNIIYNDGILPMKIIPRKTTNPLVVIGSEDDGIITFEVDDRGWYNHSITFDASWCDVLIEQLKKVKKYATEMRINEINEQLKERTKDA